MIDLGPFIDDVLNTDAFGQEALWSPTGGASKKIKGVFENPFTAVEGIGDAGVPSSMPSFLCKTSAAGDARRGDTLYLLGTVYYVEENRPNGDGFTTLILSKEA